MLRLVVAFLLLTAPALAAPVESFEAFLRNFETKAVAAGVTHETYRAATQGLTPDPNVPKLVEDLLPTEALFEPGPYRVTLDHLIERTGLDFRYLRESELPLTSGGLEGATDHVRIREDFSNLVLE